MKEFPFVLWLIWLFLFVLGIFVRRLYVNRVPAEYTFSELKKDLQKMRKGKIRGIACTFFGPDIYKIGFEIRVRAGNEHSAHKLKLFVFGADGQVITVLKSFTQLEYFCDLHSDSTNALSSVLKRYGLPKD